MNIQFKKILIILLGVIFVLIGIGNEFIVKGDSDTSWPLEPEVMGKAIMLMDGETGAVVYSKDPDKKLYPASITKIMTALLAIEKLNLEDSITFTNEMIEGLPSDAARLGIVQGETMTVKDCLYALVLRSSNDIAVALAIEIAGSEEKFGKMMTEKAKELGATNTNFVNATGLHDENHYTTARDMALITKAAISNTTFQTIWSASSYEMSPTNINNTAYTIWHRHDMMVEGRLNYYEYAEGGKTGYTDEAGRTLVTYAKKDDLDLIAVVLFSDSDHVFLDTKTLFEYGFDNFEKIPVDGEETRFGLSESGGFSVVDKINNKTSIFRFGKGDVVLPKNIELNTLDYKVYNDNEENEYSAKIVYEHKGEYLGEAILYFGKYKEESTIAPIKTEIETQGNYTMKESVDINIKYIGAVVAAILVVLFLIIRMANKKKRKSRKYSKRVRRY